MSSRSLAHAALAVALVLLSGCAAGGPPVGATAEPTPTGIDLVGGPVPPSEPVVEPAPTPSGPGQLVPPPASYPTTARAYAEATVAAWAGSNLTRLAQLTTPQVDEQFLEIPGKLKTDWIYVRCDGAAGSNYCTLRNSDGDQVLLRVLSQYLGAAHAVVELTASLTVYPANGEQYAREFVRAWQAGNTPRMRALAKPDVVVAVNNNHQNRPTGTWALGVSTEHGGAGLLIAHVDINEGAITFTLDVGTTLLGSRHAIIGYES